MFSFGHFKLIAGKDAKMWKQELVYNKFLLLLSKKLLSLKLLCRPSAVFLNPFLVGPKIV